MSSTISLGRKLFWLSLVGLLMQFTLGLTWVACTAVVVSQITHRDPALSKLYKEIQEKQSFSSVTPSASDAQRYIESMKPILARVPWAALAVTSSLLGFGFLGFFYGRMSGSSDYFGILPVFSILSGQNPITMALALVDQGIDQAQLHWLAQGALLLVQMLAGYFFAALGSRIFRLRHKTPSKPTNP